MSGEFGLLTIIATTSGCKSFLKRLMPCARTLECQSAAHESLKLHLVSHQTVNCDGFNMHTCEFCSKVACNSLMTVSSNHFHRFCSAKSTATVHKLQNTMYLISRIVLDQQPFITHWHCKLAGSQALMHEKSLHLSESWAIAARLYMILHDETTLSKLLRRSSTRMTLKRKAPSVRKERGEEFARKTPNFGKPI